MLCFGFFKFFFLCVLFMFSFPFSSSSHFRFLLIFSLSHLFLREGCFVFVFFYGVLLGLLSLFPLRFSSSLFRFLLLPPPTSVFLSFSSMHLFKGKMLCFIFFFYAVLLGLLPLFPFPFSSSLFYLLFFLLLPFSFHIHLYASFFEGVISPFPSFPLLVFFFTYSFLLLSRFLSPPFPSLIFPQLSLLFPPFSLTSS